MRKTLSIGIIILLLLAIPAHLWCAFVVFFFASAPGTPLVWAFLVAAAAPLFILCRRWVDKPWSRTDIVLAVIVALPGIAAGTMAILSGSSISALLILEMLLCAGFVAGCIYLWRNPEQDKDRMVPLDQRPATEQELAISYETMFAERGEFTPSDPLEFHLYHLARYWSRLVGFCRIMPGSPEIFADGAMGITIRVANRFMDPLVGAFPALVASWNSYNQLSERVLQRRVVLLNDVEAASEAFDRLLATASYDPWFDSPHRQSGPVRMEDLVDKGIPDNAI